MENQIQNKEKLDKVILKKNIVEIRESFNKIKKNSPNNKLIETLRKINENKKFEYQKFNNIFDILNTIFLLKNNKN